MAMMDQTVADAGPSSSGGWWVENLLRPALIAGMMACLAAPVVLLLELLIAGWEGNYLLVFFFLASLEGILAERVLHRRGISGWAYLLSRGAEILILLILLKLVNYLPWGLDQLWADAKLWFSEPGLFVKNLDLFVGLLFVPLWAGSLWVARMAIELDAEECKAAQAPPDKTSTEYYLWLTQPPIVRERQEKLDQLGEMFVWGGFYMLIASAAIHFVITSAEVLAIPTLLYFALGVALLSQGRFSVLQTGWQAQDIPVQSGITRRWLLWAIIFLGGVALVALALPTFYTMGPIQTLLGFLALMYSVLTFLVQLVLFLLSLPFLLFLPNAETPTPPPRLEPMPFQSPDTAAHSALPPWIEIVASAIFWLVVLVIVSYALIRFVRDRFETVPGEQQGTRRWLGRFLAWLRDLWQRLQTWRQDVQAGLTRRRIGVTTQRPGIQEILPFFFPGRLPPRELVRYFYLSTARRAAQAGQPRHPEQTPYEYRDSLDGRFPELEPDLEGLTESFVQARYSRQPVEERDAEQAKSFWQRIRSALRRRRGT